MNGKSENLVRKTVLTVGSLLAACVVFVGTLTVVAVGVTDRALSPSVEATPASIEHATPSDAPPPARKATASKRRHSNGGV